MSRWATLKRWVHRAFFALALLGGQPALAQPSADDFTRMMAERLRPVFPGHAIEIVEPLQLRVVTGPDPSLVNVGRLYNFCANATGDECEASIARFVSAMAQMSTTVQATLTREQLRVVVRNIEYCEWTGDGQAASAPLLIYRPYLTGLCRAIVADFPDTIRGIHTRDLDRLGLTADAAWTLAERQTLAELPDPATLEGVGQSIVLVSGYDYATSLLLDTEGWRAARERYGDFIVAVPASDTVVVARASLIENLDDLQSPVTHHFETAERGVSPTLYRFGRDGWTLAR